MDGFPFHPSISFLYIPSSLPLRSGSSRPVLPRGGRPRSVGTDRLLVLSSASRYNCPCMGCKCQFKPNRCIAARQEHVSGISIECRFCRITSQSLQTIRSLRTNTWRLHPGSSLPLLASAFLFARIFAWIIPLVQWLQTCSGTYMAIKWLQYRMMIRWQLFLYNTTQHNGLFLMCCFGKRLSFLMRKCCFVKDEFLPNHYMESEWVIEFSCWQSMGKSQKSCKPPQPL